MELELLLGFTVIVLIAGVIGILIVPDRYKGRFAFLIVIINAILTSIPAITSLTGIVQTGSMVIPPFLNEISIRTDSLSAWFILIINFTCINGIIYGMGYLKSYDHLKTNLEIHWLFYILFHISMVWVCMFENGLAFLIAWELMSVSSMMLVLFEYQNKETLKAGLNYMVQMHFSVLFLTIGFIWLFISTGSFDFAALSSLPLNNQSLWIFVLLLLGFAIKAGFIPFHTWLPHAHPAAPSHVSGVMSGVIVKLGIYGIFRIIIHLHQQWLLFGEIILIVSVLTAIYGIANAAVKYDFKRMLAFCTIENIGIIGIGIGLGLIGMGSNNQILVVLGFSAALLHTLNHSLSKSLLFFGAGSVYQQTHTRIIERLGGLIKKMPYTAALFLIGAIAISGVPPFNGFISEYLIYLGLFKGLAGATGIPQAILLILIATGLVIVGGISILTFTKTFGVIFLGNPRKQLTHSPSEVSYLMLLPQIIIITAIISVVVVPQFYFKQVSGIVQDSFITNTGFVKLSEITPSLDLSILGIVSVVLISIILLVFGIRWMLVHNRKPIDYETWGCGYVAPVPKAQYTGRSFARPFGMLFGFLMSERKKYEKINKTDLYPKHRSFVTYYFDIIEKFIIIPIARRVTFTVNYFQFIQNGQIQSYVLYGLFFILIVFLGTVFNFIK